MSLSRRDFLVAAGSGALAATVGSAWNATRAVDPVTQVDNPLQSYPNPEGRGEDEFERVSWEEAIDLIAEKMANLDDEKRFHVFNAIKADGLITRHGAGRRLASIFGGCEWTEYDWYADLPPGHVVTTGYQTSDSDASAWRQADYTIMQGKNLIHNKLADNHWLQETRERGGTMVGVYPDYSPTVQKCDRWLPVRPGSDPAFALGVAHVIIDEELYDPEFMRQFTSLPLLVREDTANVPPRTRGVRGPLAARER